MLAATLRGSRVRLGGQGAQVASAPPADHRPRRDLAHVYAALVTVAGLGLLTLVAVESTPAALSDASALTLLLIGCVAIAELTPIRAAVGARQGEFTTSTAFAFALLLSAGTAVAAPALAAGSAIADLVRRKPASRIGFNAGQYTIAVVASGAVLHGLAGIPASHHASPFLAGDLPNILVAATVFYLVNTALVATVIALVEQIGFWRYFVSDFLVQATTAGLVLGLGPIIVLTGSFSAATLPLLALPLLAVHRGARQAAVNQLQAVHDSLTGLPNRRLFQDRVEQALQTAARHHHTVAVMIMDLDRFKEINDTLGHAYGDHVLGQVAARLQDTLRGSDTIARLGGDEFGILLPEVPDPVHAVDVAGKLLTALRGAFEADGLAFEVAASIGIACYPQHGSEGETLLQRADIAMYVAKELHSGAALYAPAQDRHTPERLALAGELRRAIENGEIVLHYQPVVELASGRVTAVEALARWQHPERGLLMPHEFIPLAEHTGLVTPMTRHVLNEALRQMSEWAAQGVDLSVAVNLCPRSFLDGRLLVDIPELLERWQVEPSRLKLEITESMIIGDPLRAQKVVERLNELGTSVALDDFGTGYSALAYLTHLPVSELKIDKSFVFQMTENERTAAIVRSTIDLAHQLGISVIAEGVGNEAVYRRLRLLECDFAQGYHVSPALPAAEIPAWIGEFSAARVGDLSAAHPPERPVAALSPARFRPAAAGSRMAVA